MGNSLRNNKLNSIIFQKKIKIIEINNTSKVLEN